MRISEDSQKGSAGAERSHNIKRTVDDLQKWNEAKIEKRKEMQTKKSNAEVYSFQPQVSLSKRLGKIYFYCS